MVTIHYIYFLFISLVFSSLVPSNEGMERKGKRWWKIKRTKKQQGSMGR
jgi:hypothetical protein